MKTKFSLLLLLLAIFSKLLTAQVSTYNFVQSTNNYGAASSGTQVGSNLQDDDINSVVLPFPFVYNGQTYTTANVSANGYLSFNSIPASIYSPISDNSTQNIISAFGDDLFMGLVSQANLTTGSNTITNVSSVTGFSVGDVILDYNLNFGGINPTITAVAANYIVVNINATNNQSFYDLFVMNGYIKMELIGISPNRILEFEYANFCRVGVYDEIINFKIRLYETSNKIEAVYGFMIPSSYASNVEVGLKGNTNSDFNSRNVSPQLMWMTSLASNLITEYCVFADYNYPNPGLTFQWTPSCTSPNLLISNSNSLVCAGNTISITASGATTYSWSNGSTSAQLIDTPSLTTTYTLTGFNGSCSSSLTITQAVAPVPSLSLSSNYSTSCIGQEVTLFANGANSYTWSNGISNNSITVTPSVTTSYSLSASNGTCSTNTSITQVVLNCTGIDLNTEELNKLLVYPNPFNEEIKISNYNNYNSHITIFDASGRVLISEEIAFSDTKTISTENLQKGFYFISIANKQEKMVKILIKN